MFPIKFFYTDVDLLDGRATLHGMRQLYCRKCEKTVKLAPEAEEMVRKAKAVLKECLPELVAA